MRKKQLATRSKTASELANIRNYDVFDQKGNGVKVLPQLSMQILLQDIGQARKSGN